MTSLSPGAKALAYAEVDLGVHTCHESAVAARGRLDASLSAVSLAKDQKRDLESRLLDAEMVVSGDEHGKHPGMSATAMREHLKVAFSNDGAVRELRESISKVVGDIDGLECDIRIAEVDIKIAVARLHELGGYFEFLAAIKLTQPVTQPKESQGEPSE